MPSVAREYFTVDLRGLRAALAARAARDGMTESDVLRSALAAALGNDHVASAGPPTSHREVPPRGWKVKLSVRLLRPAAIRLGLNAGAAGLSRGAYLTRLVERVTGLTSAEAQTRVNNVVKSAKQNIDRARNSAVILAFMIATATLLGALAAWFAADIGGRQRDGVESIWPEAGWRAPSIRF